MKPKFVLLVAILILMLYFSFVSAEVPRMINYQGKLTKPSGALIDTITTIVFSIYADSTGGTALWTETQISVAIQYGVFSVLLGSVTPIPDTVFDGSERYLGVKVGDDSEMTPRKAIVSVGYAFRTKYADTTAFAYTQADSDWLFSGDNIYRSEGKVGIGTTNPISKLQIEDNVQSAYARPLYVKNTNTSDLSHSFIRVECSAISNKCQPGIQFFRPDGSMWEIALGAGDLIGDFLGFYNYHLGTVMVIDTIGSVGIGTSSPGQKLSVNGNIETPMGASWIGRFNDPNSARIQLSNGGYSG